MAHMIPPPVDLDHLRDLVDDDAEIVQELLDAYLESSPDHVEGLESSLANGDCDALRRHAHTLKGASASIGAARVAKLAEVMERLGSSGSLEEAGEAMAGLRAEYDRACSFLSQETTG